MGETKRETNKVTRKDRGLKMCGNSCKVKHVLVLLKGAEADLSLRHK